MSPSRCVKTIAVLACLVLAGCGLCADKAQESQSIWQQTLARQFPTGTPKAVVQKWVADNKMPMSNGMTTQRFKVLLETIECTIDFPCKTWQISAWFTFDLKDQLETIEVYRTGNCMK